MERLVGLTEMVPERVWNVGERGLWFSVWFVRRTAWVLGTSLALLALPPFIEQQRLEYEEMQNMQKKQVRLSSLAALEKHSKCFLNFILQIHTLCSCFVYIATACGQIELFLLILYIHNVYNINIVFSVSVFTSL